MTLLLAGPLCPCPVLCTCGDHPHPWTGLHGAAVGERVKRCSTVPHDVPVAVQVSEEQIHADLTLGKFEWDHPRKQAAAASKIQDSTKVFSDAYSACKVHLLPPSSSRPGS